MRITEIDLQNYMAFESLGPLQLGPVTLFVGRNNAGKSAILRAIYSLQRGGGETRPEHVRFDAPAAHIKMSLADFSGRFWNIGKQCEHGTIQYDIASTGSSDNRTLQVDGQNHGVSYAVYQAPNNLVVPFFADRKTLKFNEAINLDQANSVTSQMANLAARVDRVMDEHHPSHQLFMDLVASVIGLPLSSIASEKGKRIGVWVDQNRAIYIEDLGDGVAHLLAFITNLVLATDQVFLIEELENDIHPEALKLVLEVIEQRRGDLQFIISTHNNIVLRNLGALPDTKIYKVTSEIPKDIPRIPTSTATPIANTPSERMGLLVELGYELSDLELWDGWLILEEASAERIIRDHLIRWFTPRLSSVRTVASSGADDAENTFNSIYKLVLFTHLEERYRGRVMVALDGDTAGQDAVAKLKKKFPSWDEDSFRTFDRPDFEHYYPERFAGAVAEALGVTEKQARRRAKKELLDKVLDWIVANDEDARREFEISAGPVIEHLRRLESQLGPAVTPNESGTAG
jgi:predicted ATPase